MTLKTEDKKNIMGKYHRHESDTGSPEVQVAILTTRISQLTEHLKKNKHDESSRRGLLRMVGARRRHLVYLSRKSPEKYQEITDKLKLRRSK